MHHHPVAMVVLANPLEHLKSIHARHVQIQQQQVGKRMGHSVREHVLPFQVSLRLQAIAHGIDLVSEPAPFKSFPQQIHVVGVILRY